MLGRSKRIRPEPTSYPSTVVYDGPSHTHHARGDRKPGLMARLRARKNTPRTAKHTTTTTAAPRRSGRFSRRTRVEPVHHQRRKTSIGDKISGAMLKLKGSIEHKPGKKAAGTRRMHGTDGRGSRRYY